MMSVPLFSHDRVIGALHLRSVKSNAYGENDLKLAESIGAQIAGAIANAQLLRERERAEGEMRESEERHRLLFESSHDALMVLSPPEYRFSRANQATLRMFGAASEAEFTSLGPWDVSPERQADGRPSAEKARMVIEEALRKGSHFFDWTHKRLSGVEFPATVLLTRIEVGGQTLVQATVRDVTELKAAEKELAQKSALLSSLLDSIPDRVFFKDVQGVYLGCNPEFSRFVGRPREEILGLTDYDLFPKDKADFYRETDRIMMEGREPKRLETWIDYPDGRRVLSDTVKAPLRTVEGELIGLVGVSRDISELRRAEEELREQRLLLDRILDSIPAPVFYKNVEGKFLGCNSSYLAYKGLPREGIIGRTVYDISPAAIAKDIHDADQDLLESGGTQVYGALVPFADGSSREVMLHKAIFCDLGGSVLGIVGVIFDISEQKRAEKELRESEARLAATLRSIGDGVISTDASGHVVSLNAVAETLTGWSSSEALGHPITEVFPIANPGTRSEIENPIWRALKEGCAVTGLTDHAALIDHHGCERLIADSCAPIRGMDETIVGAVLVFRDVTEDYRKNEEIRADRRAEQGDHLGTGHRLDFYLRQRGLLLSAWLFGG
jgi:PAS domain S-box-containing protein